MFPIELVVWLRKSVTDEMLSEAERHYPMETGGILLGYWANPKELVVTRCVGPGPLAFHERTSFVPDNEWHIAEIARYYKISGRTDTYLGDWHTHPGKNAARLSIRDYSTLRRIAAHKKARAPIPLMIVLAGTPGNWSTDAWLGRLRRRFAVFQGLVAQRIVVKVEG